MKTVYILLMMCMYLTLLSSCESDNDNSIIKDSKSITNLSQTESFILKVIYEDKAYNVPCQLLVDKDSIIFLDDKFKDLYMNKISKLKNFVCRVNDDGSIEYLNGTDEAYQQTDTTSHTLANNTRVVLDNNKRALVWLWDDSNFGDRHYPFTVGFPVPNLKDHFGFNDKTSAIEIYNRDLNEKDSVCFRGYEHTDYRGDILERKLAYNEEVRIPKLKRIPKRNGGNWNDKISSIKFFYKHRYLTQKEYEEYCKNHEEPIFWNLIKKVNSEW